MLSLTSTHTHRFLMPSPGYIVYPALPPSIRLENRRNTLQMGQFQWKTMWDNTVGMEGAQESFQLWATCSSQVALQQVFLLRTHRMWYFVLIGRFFLTLIETFGLYGSRQTDENTSPLPCVAFSCDYPSSKRRPAATLMLTVLHRRKKQMKLNEITDQNLVEYAENRSAQGVSSSALQGSWQPQSSVDSILSVAAWSSLLLKPAKLFYFLPNEVLECSASERSLLRTFHVDSLKSTLRCQHF